MKRISILKLQIEFSDDTDEEKMARIKRLEASQRMNETKDILAELLNLNKSTNYASETIKNNWMEFAILLGDQTPDWLSPSKRHIRESRIWLILTGRESTND